jgi:hypothetical protein
MTRLLLGDKFSLAVVAALMVCSAAPLVQAEHQATSTTADRDLEGEEDVITTGGNIGTGPKHRRKYVGTQVYQVTRIEPVSLGLDEMRITFNGDLLDELSSEEYSALMTDSFDLYSAESSRGVGAGPIMACSSAVGQVGYDRRVDLCDLNGLTEEAAEHVFVNENAQDQTCITYASTKEAMEFAAGTCPPGDCTFTPLSPALKVVNGVTEFVMLDNANQFHVELVSGLEPTLTADTIFGPSPVTSVSGTTGGSGTGIGSRPGGGGAYSSTPVADSDTEAEDTTEAEEEDLQASIAAAPVIPPEKDASPDSVFGDALVYLGVEDTAVRGRGRRRLHKDQQRRLSHMVEASRSFFGVSDEEEEEIADGLLDSSSEDNTRRLRQASSSQDAAAAAASESTRSGKVSRKQDVWRRALRRRPILGDKDDIESEADPEPEDPCMVIFAKVNMEPNYEDVNSYGQPRSMIVSVPKVEEIMKEFPNLTELEVKDCIMRIPAALVLNRHVSKLSAVPSVGLHSITPVSQIGDNDLHWVTQKGCQKMLGNKARPFGNDQGQCKANSSSTDNSSSTPFFVAGITGDGVTVGISDTGLDMDHCYFSDNSVASGQIFSCSVSLFMKMPY